MKLKGTFKRAGKRLLELSLLSVLSFTPAGVLFADEGATQAPPQEPESAAPLLARRSWYSGLTSPFTELSVQEVGTKPRIRPHFYANNGFISNADLGDTQADPAWHARIAPGISITLPYERLLAEVDYTYAFSTIQGRRTNVNNNSHNLDTLLRYELTDSTTLGATNNIQWSDIPGHPNDSFMLESAVAQLKHAFTSMLDSDTRYTFQYFDDRTKSNLTGLENDFSDHEVSETINYKIQSFTISPSFSWNVRDFKRIRTKDYWQISPVLGVSYDLGIKTKVGGHFGWAHRKFDHGSSRTENELVYGTEITHLYGQKFVGQIYYDKKLADTYDTDFIFREDEETIPLDNFDRNFRVVKAHRIGTAGMYHLNERMSAGVFGDFQFINSDEKDNVLSGNDNNEKTMEIGARYTFRLNKYLSFDVLYSFGRRFTSDDPINNTRADYTFHKASAGLNVSI